MASKLHLSKLEIELVTNTEWILTKHAIIKKIYALFGELHHTIAEDAKVNLHLFPAEIFESSGKISRGENYLGLPYLILDFPALFEKNNLFAVRTMFWWGNFFSSTLHLSGINKVRITQNLQATLLLLQENNFFVCVSKKEWDHHFDEDNYVNANQLSMEYFRKIMQQDFCKVSKKIAISEIENVPVFLAKSFREIIKLLEINCQGDKTDPSPVSPRVGSGL